MSATSSRLAPLHTADLFADVLRQHHTSKMNLYDEELGAATECLSTGFNNYTSVDAVLHCATYTETSHERTIQSLTHMRYCNSRLRRCCDLHPVFSIALLSTSRRTELKGGSHIVRSTPIKCGAAVISSHLRQLSATQVVRHGAGPSKFVMGTLLAVLFLSSSSLWDDRRVSFL